MTRDELDSEPSADEPADVKDDYIDDLEFSLDRLGQAYAQIMRDSDDLSVPPAEEALDPPTPADLNGPDPLSDQLDNAPCPVTEVSVLEAILFVGAPPGVKLTAKKLASMVRDVSPKEIKHIVERLNTRFRDERSMLRIVSDQGGYRLELTEESSRWHEKFQGEIRDANLNQQVVDVLAIIAYQQPIGRRQIDAVRQRSSGAAIHQLLHRRLIEVDEAVSQPRNPAYRTAPRFLELFGLQEIDDLPQAREADAIDEFLD